MQFFFLKIRKTKLLCCITSFTQIIYFHSFYTILLNRLYNDIFIVISFTILKPDCQSIFANKHPFYRRKGCFIGHPLSLSIFSFLFPFMIILFVWNPTSIFPISCYSFGWNDGVPFYFDDGPSFFLPNIWNSCYYRRLHHPDERFEIDIILLFSNAFYQIL